MCIVSNITGPGGWPSTVPDQYPWTTSPPIIAPNQEEFDRLKQEVKELKKVLEAAKEFDEKTGQRDCEKEEEGIELIKKLAEYVGVEIHIFNTRT